MEGKDDDPSESFWRTVAPDVHHEIREHLLEGGEQLALTEGGAKRQAPLLLAPPTKPLLEPYKQKDKELSAVASSLSQAVTLGSLRVSGGRRPKGSVARSRWFSPSDGSNEWKGCILIRSSNDGSSFLIQWTEGPGQGNTKEVSRLNILFEDEDEESLSRLHEAALKIKAINDEAQRQAHLIDQIPRFEVPDMPQEVGHGIFKRVGGREDQEALLGAPTTLPTKTRTRKGSRGDYTAGPPSPSAMDAFAYDPALGDMTGPKRIKSAASAAILDKFFKQHHEASALDLSGGLLPSTPRMTQALSLTTIKVKGSESPPMQPNPNPNLPQKYGGWKADPLGTWRPFTYMEAERKMRAVMGEANDEYRNVHARLVRQAEFEQETGLPFPQELDLGLVLASLGDNGGDGGGDEGAFSRHVLDALRHPRGVISANNLRPAQFRCLQHNFTSHSLVADPFLLSAWHQSQHYITDVMLRDIFGINLLPVGSVYSTTDDIKQRIEFRHYLTSRRHGDWSLSFITKTAPHPHPNSSPLHLVPLDPNLVSSPPTRDETRSISLVEFLNIQEMAVAEELGDLKRRVLEHLANIVTDAAQSAEAKRKKAAYILHQHLLAGAGGGAGGVAASVAASHLPPPSATAPLKVDKYERLVSLLNLALLNSLRRWLTENIRVYLEGLSLYNSPSYTGPALFIISMDAVDGGAMGFYPSIATLCSKLEYSVLHAIEQVNQLPALELIKTREDDDDDLSRIGKVTEVVIAEEAPLPPFKVEASLARHPFLKTPRHSLMADEDTEEADRTTEVTFPPGSSPILDPDSPLVASSLGRIHSLISVSRVRCETLLGTFQRHADTLESYEASLKQQLGSDRAFMNKVRISYKQRGVELPVTPDLYSAHSGGMDGGYSEV